MNYVIQNLFFSFLKNNKITNAKSLKLMFYLFSFDEGYCY